MLAIHILSTQFGAENAAAVENAESTAEANLITNMDRHAKINDLVAFKSSKELYPIAMPFLEIKAKGARSKL